MKDDLISRRYLIEAFKEEFYYMYSDNFKFMLNWFENLPAVDSFKFCDQLWKIAYEHGKRDAQPATEPMTGLYVVGFNDGYEAGKEDAQQDIVHCEECIYYENENTGLCDLGGTWDPFDYCSNGRSYKHG